MTIAIDCDAPGFFNARHDKKHDKPLRRDVQRPTRTRIAATAAILSVRDVDAEKPHARRGFATISAGCPRPEAGPAEFDKEKGGLLGSRALGAHLIDWRARERRFRSCFLFVGVCLTNSGVFEQLGFLRKYLSRILGSF